jgi:outer membrane receptor protein involved in Fe transport
LPLLAAAQPPRRDTARVAQLDTVAVTAERTSTRIAGSAGAVTRLSKADVARIPHATFADVLRTVPGFAVVDFEGLGFDPQLMVRGFYGGGEAEYVVLMLDGRPLNLVHTGRAIFEALPGNAVIEAIEVVRGGTSSLYGDAAVGGVINIITESPAQEPVGAWSISGGSHGLAQVTAGGAGGGFALSLGRDDLEGFRSRGERSASHFRIRATPIDGRTGRFGVSYFTQSRSADDPGPITDAVLAVNRTGTDVLFNFDRSSDRRHEIGLDGSRPLGPRARLDWYATTDWRTLTTVRTIALAPGFGDTKQRDARLRRTMGTVQLDAGNGFLPLRGNIVLGAEYSAGSVDSRYYDVATGDREAYGDFAGGRGPISAAGDARRNSAAAFVQYSMHPIRQLRVTVGGRYDRFDDSFDPSEPLGQESHDATHEAFSPRVGLNYRYLQREGADGHVYVTAGRSFKTPTLDQLYDQRSYPVPFEPFSLTSSNHGLRPQLGVNVEAGAYQSISLTSGVVGTLSLSVYQMEMEDEIDFDIATLSYGNIAESRHRGVELGARVVGPRMTSGFLTYTLQDATSQTGDNTGHQLKAIPRHTFSLGAGFAPHPRVETGVVITRTGEAFIDDANTRTLPAYTRVDGRVGVSVGAYQIFGEARNLLGTEYNSTGYLDPSGSGTAYYYPAAGRVLLVGVRTGFAP